MAVDFSRFDAGTFNGVPDQEVLDNALPPTGTFVRSWMEYMYNVTDAALAYHLGVGLTTLATLIPVKVCLPTADNLRANMFVMVVGPSSGARKTFSVRHAREQLAACTGGPQYILGSIGSAEAFADEIIGFPRRLITADEGGHFLQHTIGGKYGAQLRSLLLEAFDSSPITRITVGAKTIAKLKSGNANAPPPREDNPRVSFLMACTKAHLEDYTFKSDWEGGFLSRFAILWARRCRNFEDAKPNPQGQIDIRAHLQRLLDIHTVGDCTGFSNDARAYYRSWQMKLNHYAESQEERTSGVIDRAQQHAKKAALVLAYDRHVTFGRHLEDAWDVSVGDVAIGCALGEMSVQSALHIERNITDNEHGQVMNRIMNFVRKADTGARTLPEILRHLNRPQKMAMSYLETLQSMELLSSTMAATARGGSTSVYYLVDGAWATSATVPLVPGGFAGINAPANPDDEKTKH